MGFINALNDWFRFYKTIMIYNKWTLKNSNIFQWTNLFAGGDKNSGQKLRHHKLGFKQYSLIRYKLCLQFNYKIMRK